MKVVKEERKTNSADARHMPSPAITKILLGSAGAILLLLLLIAAPVSAAQTSISIPTITTNADTAISTAQATISAGTGLSISSITCGWSNIGDGGNYRVTVVPVTSGTQSYSVTDPLYCNSYPRCGNGMYTKFWITVVDSGGNTVSQTSSNFATAKSQPNTKPVIELNQNMPGCYGYNAPLSFTFKVTDVDDDPAKVIASLKIFDSSTTAQPKFIWDSTNNGVVAGDWTVTEDATARTSTSRTYSASLDCKTNHCTDKLQLQFYAQDPSQMISGYSSSAFASIYPADPQSPPLVSLLPASGPYCPNAIMTAQASPASSTPPTCHQSQPSTAWAITSYEYTWLHDGVPTVVIVPVPAGSTTGIAQSTFDCAAHNCMQGNSLSVSVKAISPNGLPSSPTSSGTITISAAGQACTLPATPTVTTEQVSPYPLGIVATALSSTGGTPAAVGHYYVWELPGGQKVEGSAPFQTGSTTTTSLSPCTETTCPPGGTLKLSVYAYTTNQVKSNPYTKSWTIPQKPAFAAPTIVGKSSPLPSTQYDTDTFTFYASNAADEVDAHQYKMVLYDVDGTTVLQTSDPYGNGEVTATDKHNTNTGATPYVCAPDICRGKTIKVWARARKGSTWSDWSYFPLIIQFKRPPIPPPGLATVETTPADPQMMIDLNTGMAALLKSSTGTYTFRLTPPGGQTFTDYLATLKINGVPSTAFSAHVSGGDYVITLVCTPQLCPPGTTFEFSVSGLSNAILSLPKIFALVTSTASGLPASTGTICNADELWRWLRMMAAGMLALLGIIALVYMLGEAFHHPHLLEWSKTELGQIGMTIFIFIIIVWLVNTQCTLQIGEFLNWAGQAPGACSTGALCITPTMTLSQTALKSLEWGLSQTHITVVAIRYEMGVLNMRATYSSYKTQFPAMGGNGFSFMPFGGDYTQMGSLGMLLNLNTSFMLVLLFELFSLFFFSSSSGLFIFLVPIGLILRSVPFLRGFGGALVAIGIGFYIFYPVLLALTGIMLGPLYTGMDSSNRLGVTDVSQLEVREQHLGGTDIFTYNPGDPYPGPLMPIGGSHPPDSNSSPVDLGVYFNLTALNFVRAILIPTAGLIVTVSFVRDIAALMGEEVDATKLIAMI